jgi:endonuclease/exonuclease/phosphatase family metal-dependent hydrolase
MIPHFLTKRRTVLGQEVREPTLPALVLTVTGLVVLLGVCGAAMIALPAWGYTGWVFVGLAALLGWLVLGLRRKPGAGAALPSARQKWSRRVRVVGRWVFAGVLACWLGLIAWSGLCPGGPRPAPKADPALIRVLTWNIHCGQEHGPPWQRFDWPTRKHALQAALEQAAPDILCVQEATGEQVAFLEKALPGHCRVGVGRDDGRSGGEHCAIYFRRDRFRAIDGGTFWLEEPTDQPRPAGALNVKRICTWVRLRDRQNGRAFRVYNTHLYLTEAARQRAVPLILAHIAGGDPTDGVLVTADFNASPAAASRRLFAEAGIADSATLAGRSAGRPTFHLYGIGLWCLDGILVNQNWQVRNHLVLEVKPHNTFPSDHFGVLADLGWAAGPPRAGRSNRRRAACMNLFALSVKRFYNHGRSVEHKIRQPYEQETAR